MSAKWPLVGWNVARSAETTPRRREARSRHRYHVSGRRGRQKIAAQLAFTRWKQSLRVRIQQRDLAKINLAGQTRPPRADALEHLFPQWLGPTTRPSLLTLRSSGFSVAATLDALVTAGCCHTGIWPPPSAWRFGADLAIIRVRPARSALAGTAGIRSVARSARDRARPVRVPRTATASSDRSWADTTPPAAVTGPRLGNRHRPDTDPVVPNPRSPWHPRAPNHRDRSNTNTSPPGGGGR